jgi:glycosyltransferase involved in cell wall biosynthesis
MTDRATEAAQRRVTYIIGTYPVPTTTFIDREIQALRRSGLRVHVISLRRPPGPASERQRALSAGVHYVLPVGAADLLRSHLAFLLRRPVAYVRTLSYLISRHHPSPRARVRTAGHFALGVHIARLVRDRYPSDHLHAHFVDRAALMALVAGGLLEMPYSATAHANDIYVEPVLLPEKIDRAKFIVTCTGYNRSHLRSIGNGRSGDKVRCIHHGLDLAEFRPLRRPPHRPRILAVGQLKEKKGFRDLLEACRLLLDRGVDVECEIVGEGPQRAELEALLDRRSLRERVRLLGSLPHDAVIARYAEAGVFVLPCVIGSDGDRDGIPNVILEAMAMELPVVSTRHSGIPEAVEDGVTGLLVPPGDEGALADALERLLSDPDLRERMGARGRERVAECFDVEANVGRLMAEFAA